MTENTVEIPQSVLEKPYYENRPFGPDHVETVVRFMLDRLGNEFEPNEKYSYALPQSSIDASLLTVLDDGTHIYGTDSFDEFMKIIGYTDGNDIYECNGEKDELFSIAMDVVRDLTHGVGRNYTFTFPIKHPELVED